MRSLQSLRQAWVRAFASGATGQPPRRSNELRRATLLANARILLLAALLLAPAAVFVALHAGPLAPAIAVLAFGTGCASIAFARAGEELRAAELQVYALLVVGLLLTLADPAPADFGLAVALLAPIHAALIASRRTAMRAWIDVAAIAIAGFADAQFLPSAAAAMWLHLTGGLSFAVAGLVVAFTANRQNTAFEVYDRHQLNAFRHLIEHVQDAVMRFSAEGEPLFISRSAETLFGCRRYELTGGGLLEHVHVLDRPAFLTALADANRAGVARKLELRMRRDGSPGTVAPAFAWVEIAFSPVAENVTGDGRHEVVALFRDVTDRRDQENQMLAARRAAEEASEAKTRFLATMGHELRTPLNAIIGFSEMMLGNIGGELSPTHREYAELIRKSGSHLVGVLGMLLDMSRIEAGKFELNAESFAPGDLVEPCLKMVGPLAEEKKVRFDTHLARGLPPIMADERACRQIVINLLSNAIKFSHPGGVVSISLNRQGSWLKLSVSDTGIGMSTEAIARIGEPFFQANDGLSRRYEGAGLGLSIVKGLVDLHRGQLRIASEAGTGTTMTVLLPINGPETKLPETDPVTPLVTPLRRGEAAHTVAPWPEQKRSAR
ncbi:MAG TPA: PAS domain-containing sensor histidine kinase [Devosia sp.]|nr:PAS domain-containing sensor histidine kinase [Devosia sp.]